MAQVLIALTPAAVYGIVIYGTHALWVIVTSIAAAMAGETLFRLITKQEIRILDLSAVVTGLLLAMILPPSIPLWMTVLGAIFATVVVKEFFGGLGANIFNPALTGRAFLLMSFPIACTTWTNPKGIVSAMPDIAAAVNDTALSLDAFSGATPLGIIKTGGSITDVGRQFAAAGLSESADYFSTLKTLFMGNHSGTIGESSILLILAGCIYLLVTKVIDWRAPVMMIASAFVLSFLLGLDPVFSILTGGLVFGAVFMATDYTTAPLTSKGKFLFGAGAGIITVLIRQWGNYPEGVTYGILIMNSVTPFLNRLLQKKYGFVPPPKKEKPAGPKTSSEAAK